MMLRHVEAWQCWPRIGTALGLKAIAGPAATWFLLAEEAAWVGRIFRSWRDACALKNAHTAAVAPPTCHPRSCTRPCAATRRSTRRGARRAAPLLRAWRLCGRAWWRRPVVLGRLQTSPCSQGACFRTEVLHYALRGSGDCPRNCGWPWRAPACLHAVITGVCAALLVPLSSAGCWSRGVCGAASLLGIAEGYDDADALQATQSIVRHTHTKGAQKKPHTPSHIHTHTGAPRSLAW